MIITHTKKFYNKVYSVIKHKMDFKKKSEIKK